MDKGQADTLELLCDIAQRRCCARRLVVDWLCLVGIQMIWIGSTRLYNQVSTDPLTVQGEVTLQQQTTPVCRHPCCCSLLR